MVICWSGSTRHQKFQLSGPSSARRPASVIRTRATWIFRLPIFMVSRCAVARPSLTKCEARSEALSPVVERPLPRRCYAQAGNLDLPLARLRGLAACRGKPLAKKIGQHINADPLDE